MTELDALSGLGLSSDVQIVVPRVSELIGEIEAFLNENPGAGKRLETIRLGINEYEFNAESFLPGPETFAGLYFELVDAVRTGGAPTFDASFVADVVVLPETSFIDWLAAHDELSGIVAIDGDKIGFLPGLGQVPAGFREEKLGLLHRRPH